MAYNITVGKQPDMSMDGVGTLASVYIRLDAYILHVPCRLFSWDKGSENTGNSPAQTGWVQHGGGVAPNLTPKYIMHSLIQ